MMMTIDDEHIPSSWAGEAEPPLPKLLVQRLKRDDLPRNGPSAYAAKSSSSSSTLNTDSMLECNIPVARLSLYTSTVKRTSVKFQQGSPESSIAQSSSIRHQPS